MQPNVRQRYVHIVIGLTCYIQTQENTIAALSKKGKQEKRVRKTHEKKTLTKTLS